MNTFVVIITGDQGKGKTTFIRQLASLIREAGMPAAGFCAPGYWENNERTGFDLLEINGAKQLCLCNTKEEEGDVPFRRYYFKPQALIYGTQLLVEAANSQSIVVIDEVGLLELEGNGWAEVLDILSKNPPKGILLSVRTNHVEKVIKKWKMDCVSIFDITAHAPKEVLNWIKTLYFDGQR